MKLTMTKKEAEEIFYNSLCNGLGEMSGYDLDFVYDKDAYKVAKSTLKEKNPNDAICYEDVLMQLLREGGKLTFVDVDAEEAYSITMKEVHSRVKNTPIQHLIDYMQENDDAYTADAVLQTVFFKEIIYG